MNQLAVTGVIPLEQSTEADVLFAGALASQEANQDPIDLAFLAAAKERHIFDNLPKVTPRFVCAVRCENRGPKPWSSRTGSGLRVDERRPCEPSPRPATPASGNRGVGGARLARPQRRAIGRWR